MSADITELIEGLARHEGGALGAAPVVILAGEVEMKTGKSVDEVLVHFRAIASLPFSGSRREMVVTHRPTGDQVRLDRVLGYHLPTGRVAIAGTVVPQ